MCWAGNPNVNFPPLLVTDYASSFFLRQMENLNANLEWDIPTFQIGGINLAYFPRPNVLLVDKLSTHNPITRSKE